jgi:hypothetical protein
LTVPPHGFPDLANMSVLAEHAAAILQRLEDADMGGTAAAAGVLQVGWRGGGYIIFIGRPLRCTPM